MVALWRRGLELEDDGGSEEEEPTGRAKDNTLGRPINLVAGTRPMKPGPSLWR